MPKTVSVEEANEYFAAEVLHNEPWEEADDDRKLRALNNAENILYRHYSEYYEPSDESKQIPKVAVFEQALWLLRQDDAILAAEMGVVQTTVSGISVLTKGEAVDLIAPEARRIVNDDLGNNASGRFSWTVM